MKPNTEIIIVDDVKEAKEVNPAFVNNVYNLTYQERNGNDFGFTNPNSRSHRRKKLKPKRIKNKRL
jgi:hypothetical protein